ncbi:MAG TPA: PD-(D/E)XK nuclease family protein [Planctomycetota bacterium]|nr:PD-(D/E)XK nuclease family protein [Planctomycetota bacterium]
MAELRHELSWSASRSRAFEECRRAYFYLYYGSWRGWERDAPPPVRRAYILKQLTNLDILAGSAVHAAIAWFFARRREGAVPTRREVEERALEAMRAVWRQSTAGGWEEDPKRNARLHEHHYRGDLSKPRTDRVKGKVLRSVETFFDLPALAPVREAPAASVVLCEERDGFSFEGRKIHAVPDLALREGDDLVLFDWKTGRPSPTDRLQLAVYALYAGEKLGARPPRVRGVLAYLNEGRLDGGPIVEEELDAAREGIRRSLAAMGEIHFDPDARALDPEPFPMSGYPRACPRCNFRELCGV